MMTEEKRCFIEDHISILDFTLLLNPNYEQEFNYWSQKYDELQAKKED